MDEESKQEAESENQDSLQKRKDKINKLLFGWVKDNYDKLFIVILIAAFILRLWIFFKTQDQAIWWDAGDYLATAKNWAGVNPYMLDNWYYRRGYLWPLFGAIFFKFGFGDIGLRFAVTLFSTGIVFVSYHLVKKIFNKKLALLTSVALSLSWIFLFFSGRPLTNLPATFFLLTAVLFFWKGYMLKEGNKFIYLFGLFFAFTCLTRMQYLMFATPLLVMTFTKEKFKFLSNKHLWIAVGIFALVFIPQMYMHNQHFGNPLLDLTKYYLGVGVSATGEVGGLGGGSTLHVYFTNLPYILDGNNNGYSSLFTLSPMYVLFLIGFFWFFIDLFLGFDRIFSNKDVQKKLFVLVWIVSTFLFLGYITPHLEQRYMMQTLPFLFLIAVFPLSKISDLISEKSKLSKNTAFFIVIVVLILFLIPNITFGNNLTELKKTSYLEVKQSGEWIKENSNPEDIVISSSFPQTAYYSERASYPFHLGYRRDIPRENINGTLKFIQEQKPRYMVISVFEQIPDLEYWSSTYPREHQDTLIPVQVYKQGEQPVLVIYEFKYNQNSNIQTPISD